MELLWWNSAQWEYRNYPKFSDRQVWANSVDLDQTAVCCRVYTDCHSICIFWIHYSVVKWYCSNFMTITAIFSCVRIFRIFTVDKYNEDAKDSIRNWATTWQNLFLPYTNNKGADQPVHPHSLISPFVVRCLDSKIPLLAKAGISRL